MNPIQKMIYRVQRRKYGDARKSMLLLKYPNAFFLKPEYTADQYAEETSFTRRKAMIDWSWERWQLWCSIRKSIKNNHIGDRERKFILKSTLERELYKLKEVKKNS